MEYTTSINTENTSEDTFASNLMNITNLDEIESHYSDIFTKVDTDALIYLLMEVFLEKKIIVIYF